MVEEKVVVFALLCLAMGLLQKEHLIYVSTLAVWLGMGWVTDGFLCMVVSVWL